MAILWKFPSTDLADSALDCLLEDLQHQYSNIPGPKTVKSDPSFERYKFSILDFTDKDFKDKSITLQVDLYESLSESVDSMSSFC